MSLPIRLTTILTRLRPAVLALSVTALLLGVGESGSRAPLLHAQRVATLLDGQVAPGGQVNIQGHDFPPGATFAIEALTLGTRQDFSLGNVTSDRSGTVGPKRFMLPAEMTPGTYELRARAMTTGALVATAQLAVQNPPAFELSPTSGAPGTQVDITVRGLEPGSLLVTFDGAAVLGPLPVRDTTYSGRFVVPSSRSGAAATVVIEAINLAGNRTVGKGQADFALQATPTPRTHTVDGLQTSRGDLLPGDQLSLSGTLNPPPSGSPAGYQLIPFWEDDDGNRIPIGTEPVALQASGAFVAPVQVPSMLRGDAFSAKQSQHFGVQLVGPDETTDQLVSAVNVFKQFETFRVTAVKDLGDGAPNDGKPIPNLPSPGPGEPDPLQVTIEPVGVFSLPTNNPLDLSGAEPLLDVATILYKVKADQAILKGAEALDKFVNCIKWVDQTSELKWWEWVIDPWDASLVSTLKAPVLDPGFNAQFETPVNAAAQGQPGDAQPLAADVEVDPDTLFFIYRVEVDATNVQDADGPFGYGLVDAENFAIPTEVWFAWVPAYDLIFEMDLETLTAAVTPNPAPVRMPPLPQGWKSNLHIDEVDTGGYLMDPYDPDPTLPRYGYFHTFYRGQYPGDINPAITFDEVEPHVIKVYLSNTGYDVTFIDPIVTVQYDGQSLPVVKNDIAEEDENGHGSCYKNDVQIPDALQNFVWEATVPNGHRRTPGSHLLTVIVSDGNQTTVQQNAVLEYRPYPAWYDTYPLTDRHADWTPTNIFLRAQSLNPNQAKTSVSDNIDELPNNQSQVNAASSFECKIDYGGFGILDQAGDMNSAAVANPAAELPIDEWSYGCSSDLDPSMQLAGLSADGTGGELSVATVAAVANAAPASVQADEKPVTILDTGKIRIFQATYGIPGIATVGIAVDFRVYATALINTTVTSGVFVDFDSGVQVDIFIEADILLGLASVDFGFTSDIGVVIPVGFEWDGNVVDPETCFHYQLDLFYDIEVLWGAINVSDGTYNIFKGDEANGCYDFASFVAAAAIDGPPSSNPSVATDGFGQTLALWRTEDGDIVYSLYNGAWDMPQPVVANGKSGDPAVAFFGPNQAIAVWSQSGASSAPAAAIETSEALSLLTQQHLAYAVWDGTSWSSPQDLTTPTTGDGKVALAGCPATASGCPANGAVTAVWVHDTQGDIAQRKFRLMTSTYTNGVWDAAAPVDPNWGNSEPADVTPQVAYVEGVPLVTWVRDNDRQPSTLGDQRIALRFLNGGTVQTPNTFPTGALNPALTVDANGDVQMAFTVVGGQDGLLTNRRALYRGKGTCGGTTTCNWQTQKLQDPFGRTIYAEQPVVTVDGNNLVTLTYRAMGYDPAVNPQTPVSTLQEPLGIVQHTGELTQLDLSSALTGSSMPNYLTGDGATNWRAAAVYVPPLDTTLALAVKGPAPAASAAAVALAADVAARTEVIDPSQPVIFVDTPRLPNFVLRTVDATLPDASGGVTLTATILNAGLDWSAAGDSLPVAAFWDDRSYTGEAAGSATLDALAAGESKQVTIPLSPAPVNPGGLHTLEVIVNRGQVVTEQTDRDNSKTVVINGLLPPVEMQSQIVAGQRVAALAWTPPDDPRIVGYRVYRMGRTGYEPVGTTNFSNWADPTVAWNTSYEYMVRSYDVNLVESADGPSIVVAVPPQPDGPLTLPNTIYENNVMLPVLINQTQ